MISYNINQNISKVDRINRESLIKQLSEESGWDVVVIGGGATGLGIALDSMMRGYRTLLVEQVDYSKGTSSRSTKLVHGGVRYFAHHICYEFISFWNYYRV